MNLKTGTPQASYRRHSHSDSPGLVRAQPRLRLRGSGAPRGGLGAGSLQDPAFRPEASFLLLFYFFFFGLRVFLEFVSFLRASLHPTRCSGRHARPALRGWVLWRNQGLGMHLG